MIAFIKGKVFAYGVDYVIVETNNGVGYRINFGHPEAIKLNQEVIIYTYQNVREDEISLFGFVSMDEYDLFVKLIQVKGLGPKTAMNMLKAANTSAIIQAIENNDVSFMKKMPGVGAKTASQIILDLKGKLVESKNEKLELKTELNDAIEALKSLGFKQNEINQITQTLSEKDGYTLDQYVKLGLQLLNAKKRG